MPIQMLENFKSYKKGEIVNPESDLQQWLISRQYATPAESVPAEQPETPQTFGTPTRKGRK